MAKVTITYYLDVLSSWCLIAEDALARVRSESGPQVDVVWKIAALRDPFGYTPDMIAWFYRRTASITGTQLDPAWLTSTRDGSAAANLAAEATRSLGCTDDRVRLAIARGVMLRGKPGCGRGLVAGIAAQAGGIDLRALEKAMDDPAAAEAIKASSDEFAALGVGVRPTFVLDNGIGDRSVLAGCWRYEVLAAAVAGMLADHEGYERFVAANPPPPGAS